MPTKKVIEGKTLFGDLRKYTFNLLTAETGGELFHNIAPKLFQFVGDEIDIKAVAGSLSDVFTWDDIKGFAKTLLAGSNVEIDDRVLEIGDNGVDGFPEGDPMEIYTAIFYALKANFPKYISPLTDGGDLSPEDAPAN